MPIPRRPSRRRPPLPGHSSGWNRGFPSSFDVTADGTVAVLDQVNARVERWSRADVRATNVEVGGGLADFAFEPGGSMFGENWVGLRYVRMFLSEPLPDLRHVQHGVARLAHRQRICGGQCLAGHVIAVEVVIPEAAEAEVLIEVVMGELQSGAIADIAR